MAIQKNMIFAIVAVLIVVVGAVGVVAITSNSSHTDTKQSDDEYYKYGVTINNRVTSSSSDNVITVYAKPKVYCIEPGNIEVLCALGMQDCIVGAYVYPGMETAVNEKYKEAFDKIVNDEKITIKGSPLEISKEKILASECDMIMTKAGTFTDSMGGCGSKSYWAEYGVQCFSTNIYGNASGTGIDTYLSYLADVGKLFNAVDAADKIITTFKDKVESIKGKVASLKESEKAHVFVCDPETSWTRGGVVYGTDCITGKLIEAAGGICASSERMVRHTQEEWAKNYTYDFVMTVSAPRDQSVVDWWNSYETLKAVNISNDRINYNTSLYMNAILNENVLDELFATLYPNLA